jgi:mono/diheme cytochrome c family protein
MRRDLPRSREFMSVISVTPDAVRNRLRLACACAHAFIVLAVALSLGRATPPQPPRAELAWDSLVQEHHAQPGESAKRFGFAVSNPSAGEIVITAITPSCGCTVVKMPPLPWKLAPGASGRIEASMDWAGRFGLFSKAISVETSAGPQVLTLRIQIPNPEGMLTLPLTRARNLQAAVADRQAVFRQDCARCHAAPATGLQGEKLYLTACGICHEAAHRATMVPDLKALKRTTDAAFWRESITHGKPGSLMPAFAQSDGGPLDGEQIESLVAYLQTWKKP